MTSPYRSSGSSPALSTLATATLSRPPPAQHPWPRRGSVTAGARRPCWDFLWEKRRCRVMQLCTTGGTRRNYWLGYCRFVTLSCLWAALLTNAGRLYTLQFNRLLLDNCPGYSLFSPAITVSGPRYSLQI